ncbi:16S rRNA (guanine(527)-N(7))-methyltransferase RsmG [Sphingobacterium spiritivorum]|uniref:Ribosomal RNA small subunit methyltransferase G n=1 Tax=Sphingobacterium spiritivorum ATCC 33861 TaxID=525373 RepID=D7VGU7_SPHSI|nr:16S rRNA (guanine(527)-N(7))-methyltransferase RsmG [Sphingobacterium spiritivorum]EFK59299.1 16S rRNA methyltransferase GidB [Sphingobacterium spiritivorum ATCC 33861]QQT34007.1 16S rRNA (guanine(527)-N(7))-methyltransferase RsmG [Sphingobacterium spiritivorum]WQD34831.1 16S rRNA (guanine(527)-N(7))-methyltransferase RsmG [Sphingobacterium spiritivorum]SUI98549.1 Ribosomal RNA small subunit methyltransferase G [Sphingobacterium spiritivorum]
MNPSVDIIYKYFPKLTETQKNQFAQLAELYPFWNNQINVISRKDIESLYLHHVLHSLGIAKFMTEFAPGTHILDVGTGGGFPGIPLAILFPEVKFHLVDSIGKKIKVVREVATALGLTNVEADHMRAEQLDYKYDFVVSRAVTRLGDFTPWIRNKFLKQDKNGVPNGILYLKGGDLKEEIKESRLKAELHPLSDYFTEDFFETKYVVYVPM